MGSAELVPLEEDTAAVATEPEAATTRGTVDSLTLDSGFPTGICWDTPTDGPLGSIEGTTVSLEVVLATVAGGRGIRPVCVK